MEWLFRDDAPTHLSREEASRFFGELAIEDGPLAIGDRNVRPRRDD